MHAWHEYATKVSLKSGDKVMPYLIGLAIGIARDDAFLINFCGTEVKQTYEKLNIEPRLVLGELEAVVVFMKAAASKNRIASKINQLVNP